MSLSPKTTSNEISLNNNFELKSAQTQQEKYWSVLIEVRYELEYMILYRNMLSKEIWLFDLLKAVASSGAIAAWAIVQSHPMIWGGIIATSQLAEVVKGTLPMAKRHAGCSSSANSLEALFIDVSFEWDRVSSGQLDDTEISSARRNIELRKHDLMKKAFPDGLPPVKNLKKLAEESTQSYISSQYSSQRITQ